MSKQAPLLEAEGVDKRYGNVVALHDADLAVQAGEIHALLGANGAGKSTLVKILSGVVPADAGQIRIDGQPVALFQPSDAMGAGLATVFQDPALVPDLTIASNLRLTDVHPDRVRAWLARLGLADLDLDAVVAELPLPVLRLVDLARALAQQPRLLVLDELTAALPAAHVETVFEVMTELRDEGRAVIFITHRLGEVSGMCDRATVLRDGSDVAVLTVEENEGDEHRLVEAMLGEVADTVTGGLQRGGLPTEAPVVFAAHDVRARRYVNGLSLELRAGEVLGVVGLEGQGQDRLFDVLSGNRPFDGGEIHVNGDPVRPRSPYDMVRRGVVLVPADRLEALLPQRSVRENLASALYNRVARWFGLVRDEGTRVGEAIDRLEIDRRAGRQARRLSGGNQQKVVLGRWLVSGFRTLLCFDPTRGIDVRTKEQIYQLLRELADQGAAILYYTSEFTEAPTVCDRILVLYDGRIVSEVSPTEADEATLLHAAHGLTGVAR